MDNVFWIDDKTTYNNQVNNPQWRIHTVETMKLIDKLGGLCGAVLDIGTRNFFTETLEIMYNVKIDSTSGELEEVFICPKEKYDFIHYNNVIEHQYNPLYTLLEIKKHLKPNGLLIIGCPLKPKWITSAKCHFHEFDRYAYDKLIDRAGFKIVEEVLFMKKGNFKGIRNILSMHTTRAMVGVLISKEVVRKLSTTDKA